MNLSQKLFVGAMIAIAAYFVYFFSTRTCIEGHTELIEYVEQPVYIDAGNIKIPVGGGRITRRNKFICDKY